MIVGFVLGAIASFLAALLMLLTAQDVLALYTPDMEVTALIMQSLPVFFLAVES
jgi:hypothetical protein